MKLFKQRMLHRMENMMTEEERKHFMERKKRQKEGIGMTAAPHRQMFD